MTWRVRLETAHSRACAIVLVASSCIALPGVGQARDTRSCTFTQTRSPPGTACIKQSEQDLLDNKTDLHILVCDATSVQCCVKKKGSIGFTQCTAATSAPAGSISTVTVNNTGKLPLKVVILDMGKSDIGRTADYKTGSIGSITLKTTVSKYHWEVFAPGDVEPCQVGHDETRLSITVGCQVSKAEEKKGRPAN
jgi:hypothetical protein